MKTTNPNLKRFVGKRRYREGGADRSVGVGIQNFQPTIVGNDGDSLVKDVVRTIQHADTEVNMTL